MDKIIVKEINAKHALGKSGMKELSYAYNPYLGCFHGCKYCYAIDMSPEEASSSWGNVIFVRKNIIEILKREIHSLKRGIVGVSTITDPYQFVERKYKLAGEGIKILASSGFHVSVQTKSPMVLKDLEIFKEYKKNIDVGITVTTLKKDISKVIEPHAPSPESRMRALKNLSGSGIDTWLFLGPLIRNVNDSIDDIEKIILFCQENGIRIIYDSYQNYAGTLEYMKYVNYLPSTKKWWSGLSGTIEEKCREYGVNCVPESLEWEYEQDKIQKKLF